LADTTVLQLDDALPTPLLMEEEINRTNVNQLKEELQKWKLSTNGKKVVLQG